VKVAKKFLDEHPEEAGKCRTTKKIVSVETISRFLGWNSTKVTHALERIRLIDEGWLDKEAVESSPTDNAARKPVVCISEV
jgi:hypothetical protein